MNPELFRIPVVDWPIKSYGLMLMIGFLSAIWLAMKRAERVKANPDIILNCGILSLFFGVAGARIFFVAHYWESSFAYLENPTWAAINLTSGGLEYLGGFIGAFLAVMVYIPLYGRLFARRERPLSLRLYLDIIAPVAMYGLAFGRTGCFLNGCCWGGLCVDEHDHKVLPWALTFPFASGAHERQWSNRQATVPAELIVDEPTIVPETTLLPRFLLERPPESWGKVREYEEVNRQYLEEKAKGAQGPEFDTLKARWETLARQNQQTVAEMNRVIAAQQYPSRHDPSRKTTISELLQLSEGYRSVPVHPVQLYGIVNALLLAWLLLLILNRRKRHGVVMGWMLLIYPISRFILELIRVDNPHDFGPMTISQAFGLAMFLSGVVWMVVICKFQPLRSPYAIPWTPPPEELPGRKPEAKRA